MMSETVITNIDSEVRNGPQAQIAERVLYRERPMRHSSGMFTTAKLLDELRRRGIRNGDVARALDVHPSRVTEIYKGERVVKLDEAAKIVEAFGLESPVVQKVPALPGPVARLIVLYLAEELKVRPSPHRVAELSADIRAFAEFVADPKVRQSVESAEAFFQAMRLRRPEIETEDPQGSDLPTN